MYSYKESKRIRTSTEFKELTAKLYKLNHTNKTIAVMLSNEFNIPISPTYVSTVLYRLGLRKAHVVRNHKKPVSPYDAELGNL